MLSRRSMVLAVILGVAIAGAAQAQGNGPGFHAAVIFGGGCNPAQNQTVSSPTPPATVGPDTAPCISGTATAAGEAAATTLRASSRSEHVCCGTGSASNGRARIQIDNVVIIGPAAASIPVSINFRVRGTLTSHPDFGQAGVFLFVRLSGFNTLGQSTSAIDMSSTGFLNQTGVFAPLSLGFPASAIDQAFVTPVANAAPNHPLRLDFELMAYSDMAGLGATESDFFSGTNGVALPFGTPVFNLPPGYTVSIPELNIVNNFVALPASFSGDISIVGTSASEVSLGTVTSVTGSVNVSGNTSATGIDLSSLETVIGAVDVSGNTSALGIDLSALTSAGAVDVSGNMSATGIDLGALETAVGLVDVSGNTSAQGISLPALASAGAVDVSGNTAATNIDLGALETAVGVVDVSGNTSAQGISLPALTTAGAVDVSGNIAATNIDLGSLQQVGGSFNVSNNGPCTSVIVGSLATVTGDLTLESCGTGTYSVGPAAAGGNTWVSTAGYDSVAGTTAAGTTTISNARGDARLTVQLQASSFVTPTSYSLTRLDPATLVPEVGLAAGGGAATIDPIAAYQITFGVPLNRDATLTFDIFPSGLDAATAAALLDAVTNGTVTLVTRADTGGPYQAFPVCAGGAIPTPDGCILVQLLDVEGQPTTGAPAIVRFVGVTGHFSTWGVALVAEGATPTFAFNGLLPPYPAPSDDATPAFKRGRVVPLKFAWVDGAGVWVDSAAAAPSVRLYQVSCSSLAPSSEAIPLEDAGESGGLRYDPESMTWIFNWSTRSLAPGCFSIEVSAGNAAFAVPASAFPVALRR